MAKQIKNQIIDEVFASDKPNRIKSFFIVPTGLPSMGKSSLFYFLEKELQKDVIMNKDSNIADHLFYKKHKDPTG